MPFFSVDLSDLFAIVSALTPRWFGPEFTLQRDDSGYDPFSVDAETWSFSSPPPNGHQAAQFLGSIRSDLADISSHRVVESACTLLVIASQEGKFLLVNSYAESMLGWSVPELLNREFIQFVHPEDVTRTLNTHSDHSSGAGTAGFENRYRRKDGSYVWLRWHSSVQENGLIYASATEVTAEVVQRQRNANLEELHNAAAELAQMGVYEVDLVTGDAWWSDEVKRIHEVPLDYKPRLDKAIEFYPPEARPKVNEAIDYAITTGNTWNFELPFITAKGRHIWVRAFGRAEYDVYNKPIRLRGGFQDVTARVKQEEALRLAKNEAEEASAAKSAFMAAMSHEIRNPVNGLLGVLRILQDTDLNNEQRRLVRLMEDSGDSLTHLLNRVLELTRLESAENELATQAIDLSDLCSRSLAALASMRPDVETSIESPGALWVHTDGAALRQVLDNLISNALKYTPAGRVRVTVAQEGDAQIISVIDTGVGIATERMESIFRRFHRATPPENDGYMGGTGLGLSIARELTALLGGTLTVQSKLGAGSTFTVSLALPASEPQQRGLIAPPVALAQLTGLRVLVVEDEPISRFVASKMLRHWGIEVREAHDGAQAVEAVADFSPHIILMDCVMPVLDGWETAHHLRARGVTCPIIAVTGSSTEIDIQRAFAAGMNDHLSKPIRPEALHARLRYWTSMADVETTSTS